MAITRSPSAKSAKVIFAAFVRLVSPGATRMILRSVAQRGRYEGAGVGFDYQLFGGRIDRFHFANHAIRRDAGVATLRGGRRACA